MAKSEVSNGRYYTQGRLSLYTDGDKCAMVNFGGMKKFNIKI